MGDKICELYSEKQVLQRIAELGIQISREYAGKEIHMVCVLKGASVFFTELAKRIDVPVYFDFIKVSSYGSNTESSGAINIIKDVDEPINGKDVIIVEDIIDSGNTLACLMQLFKERNPASLKLAVLLDKPERRATSVAVDYIGFQVPDLFIVGFGLDYAQKYRNLPYIGTIER